MAESSVPVSETTSGGIQDDAANYILTSLFGPGWQNVVSGGSDDSMYASVLFNMFELFNSSVLLAVGVFMVWTIASGLAGASFAGKKPSETSVSLWTPTRMAYSVAILAPLPTIGLSALQAVILAMILSSVNLANDLMIHTVTVMKGDTISAGESGVKIGNGSVTPLIFDMDNNYQEIAKKTFQMAYLANAASGNQSDFSDAQISYQPSNIPEFFSTFFNEDEGLKQYTWSIFAQSSNSSSSLIGQIVLKCSSSDKEMTGYAVCDAKSVYLNDMMRAQTADAKRLLDIVERREHGESIKITCGEAGGILLTHKECAGHKIKKHGDRYIRKVSTAISQMTLHGFETQFSENLEVLENNLTNGGFVLLGAYYWKITRINEQINEALKSDITLSLDQEAALAAATSSAGFGPGSGQEFSEKVKALDSITLASSSTNEVLKRKIEESSNPEAGIMQMLQAHYVGTATGATATAYILGGEEPISVLQNLGLGMITAVDSYILAISLKETALKLLSVTAEGVAKGVEKTPLGWAGGAIIANTVASAAKIPYIAFVNYKNLFLEYAGILTTALVTAAFFLAYYLPALPTILWLMAIIGWLILVVEALVAAPIWAAAHAIPEGEGIAGQHGRTGYMMFLNILLRPALMVFGFMIAIALVNATATLGAYMLQQGLMTAKEELGFFGFGGPFAFFMGFVSSIVIITIAMVTVVHKTFNLITWLPENAIKWAGSMGHASLGENSDESRVASVFAGVSRDMGSKNPMSVVGPPSSSSMGNGTSGSEGMGSGGKSMGNQGREQAGGMEEDSKIEEASANSAKNKLNE